MAKIENRNSDDRSEPRTSCVPVFRRPVVLASTARHSPSDTPTSGTTAGARQNLPRTRASPEASVTFPLHHVKEPRRTGGRCLVAQPVSGYSEFPDPRFAGRVRHVEPARRLRPLFRRAYFWWRRTDSNRRPPACKAGALPLSYAPIAERRYSPPSRSGAPPPSWEADGPALRAVPH